MKGLRWKSCLSSRFAAPPSTAPSWASCSRPVPHRGSRKNSRIITSSYRRTCFAMRRTLSMLAIGALLLAGCDQLPWNQSQAPKSSSSATSTEPPKAKLDDPGVLALVNGKPITTEMFKNQVEAFPDLPESDKREFMTQYGKMRSINRRPRDAAERRILLEELAKEELAVQEAIAVGL